MGIDNIKGNELQNIETQKRQSNEIKSKKTKEKFEKEEQNISVKKNNIDKKVDKISEKTGKELKNEIKKENISISELPKKKREIINKAASMACLYPDHKKIDPDRSISTLKGIGVGTVASLPATILVTTPIHEYSHAVANKICFENSNPKVVMACWDDILKGDWGTFTKRLLGEEPAAWCYRDSGTGPTKFGNEIGSHGRDAVIAIAGTIGASIPLIPTYIIGHKIKEKHPAVGYALMGSALTMHAANASYAFTVFNMNKNELEHTAATTGNDFAHFAVSIGSKYNIDPTVVAKVTAIGLGLSLPALGLGLYLHDKYGKKSKLITDQFALSYLLGKVDNDPVLTKKVSELYDKYPGKNKLLNAEKSFEDLSQKAALMDNIDRKTKSELKKSSKYLEDQLKEFNLYMIENLQPELKQSSKEMQEIIEKNKPQLQKIIEKAQVGSQVGMNATIVAQSVAKIAGSTVGATLGKIIPAFAAVDTVMNTYDTVKDVRNENLSKRTKALSISKLVTSAASLGLITVSAFTGGLAIPIVLGTMGASLGLTCARNRSIKKDMQYTLLKGYTQEEQTNDKKV